MNDTTEWNDKPGCPGTERRSYVDGRFTAEISAYGDHVDSYIANRVFWVVWETRHGKRAKLGGGSMRNTPEARQAARDAADSTVTERATLVGIH